MTDPITIQWTPVGGLPRRLTFESDEDGARRIEREWTGSEWRACGVERVTQQTINPTDDPPTLTALLDRIRHTWHAPDPPVLAFTPGDDVVAAVEGHLRYRTPDAEWWHTVSETDLERHLRTTGYPTIQPLSATPYSRTHFSTTAADTNE